MARKSTIDHLNSDDYDSQEEEIDKFLGNIEYSVDFPQNSLHAEEEVKQYSASAQQSLFSRHLCASIMASEIIKLNNSDMNRYLICSFEIFKDKGRDGLVVFDLWKRKFFEEYVIEMRDINFVVYENYFLCFSMADLSEFKLMKVLENGKIEFVKNLKHIRSFEFKGSDILVVHNSFFKLKHFTKEELESRESISCFSIYHYNSAFAEFSPDTYAIQLLKYDPKEGGSVISYGGSTHRSYSTSDICRTDFNENGECVTKRFDSIFNEEAARNATTLVANRYLVSFFGYYKDRLAMSSKIGVFDCLFNCRIGHFTLESHNDDQERNHLYQTGSQAYYLARGNRIVLFGGGRSYVFHRRREDIGLRDLSIIEMKLPTFVLPPLLISDIAKQSYADIGFQFLIYYLQNGQAQ